VIKLLADENVPLPTVWRLREDGFDVSSMSELNPGVDDLEVLRTARQEQRILITFDRDFGELIFRDLAPVPPGVVYLRVLASYPEEPAGILADLLSNGEIDVAGRFTVVTRDHVRQRDLP
jgi:predicted nuclease of predicted toxin-antitoxin system